MNTNSKMVASNASREFPIRMSVELANYYTRCEKALQEIATMPASKHRYDGLRGAADMQNIALTTLASEPVLAREADLSDAIAITKAAAAKADAGVAGGIHAVVTPMVCSNALTEVEQPAVIKIPAEAIEASESLRSDVLAHRSIIMPHEATEDCQHAGCIYLATHGKYCTLHANDDITVITDDDLPCEFSYDAMYDHTLSKEQDAANVEAFKAYCKANSIFYYGRSREHFFKFEAFELARKAGCTKLLMEDLS